MKPIGAIAIAAAFFWAGPGQGQDVDQGGEYFLGYCAACHGETAQGGGPMSKILTVTPPDLTGLAARNGGVFPFARVVYRIDGRDPLAAHGGVMPIFGDLFEGETAAMKSETGQPILVGRGIADLVAWLEAVQE